MTLNKNSKNDIKFAKARKTFARTNIVVTFTLQLRNRKVNAKYSM